MNAVPAVVALRCASLFAFLEARLTMVHAGGIAELESIVSLAHRWRATELEGIYRTAGPRDQLNALYEHLVASESTTEPEHLLEHASLEATARGRAELEEVASLFRASGVDTTSAECCHCASGAVKRALRNHAPLLTLERHEAFIAASRSGDEDALRALKADLPPTSAWLLDELLAHARAVLAHEETNRMTSQALAITLFVNVLRSADAMAIPDSVSGEAVLSALLALADPVEPAKPPHRAAPARPTAGVTDAAEPAKHRPAPGRPAALAGAAQPATHRAAPARPGADVCTDVGAEVVADAAAELADADAEAKVGAQPPIDGDGDAEADQDAEAEAEAEVEVEVEADVDVDAGAVADLPVDRIAVDDADAATADADAVADAVADEPVDISVDDADDDAAAVEVLSGDTGEGESQAADNTGVPEAEAAADAGADSDAEANADVDADVDPHCAETDEGPVEENEPAEAETAAAADAEAATDTDAEAAEAEQAAAEEAAAEEAAAAKAEAEAAAAAEEEEEERRRTEAAEKQAALEAAAKAAAERMTEATLLRMMLEARSARMDVVGLVDRRIAERELEMAKLDDDLERAKALRMQWHAAAYVQSMWRGVLARRQMKLTLIKSRAAEASKGTKWDSKKRKFFDSRMVWRQGEWHDEWNEKLEKAETKWLERARRVSVSEADFAVTVASQADSPRMTRSMPQRRSRSPTGSDRSGLRGATPSGIAPRPVGHWLDAEESRWQSVETDLKTPRHSPHFGFASGARRTSSGQKSSRRKRDAAADGGGGAAPSADLGNEELRAHRPAPLVTSGLVDRADETRGGGKRRSHSARHCREQKKRGERGETARGARTTRHRRRHRRRKVTPTRALDFLLRHTAEDREFQMRTAISSEPTLRTIALKYLEHTRGRTRMRAGQLLAYFGLDRALVQSAIVHNLLASFGCACAESLEYEDVLVGGPAGAVAESPFRAVGGGSTPNSGGEGHHDSSIDFVDFVIGLAALHGDGLMRRRLRAGFVLFDAHDAGEVQGEQLYATMRSTVLAAARLHAEHDHDHCSPVNVMASRLGALVSRGQLTDLARDNEAKIALEELAIEAGAHGNDGPDVLRVHGFDSWLRSV